MNFRKKLAGEHSRALTSHIEVLPLKYTMSLTFHLLHSFVRCASVARAEGVVSTGSFILKTDQIFCDIPVPDVLPSSSTLCSLTEPLLNKQTNI